MTLILSLLALHCVGAAIYCGFKAAIGAVDRGLPVRLGRVALSRWFREWGVTVLAGLSLPFGAWQPDPKRTPESDLSRVPVLLLPGYGMNRACLFPLVFYLRERGWSYLWGVNNRPHAPSIATYAARLGEHVQHLKRESGAPAVDLVCHSAGGIIAAYYLSQLGGAAHVRRLITLGTPWRGTRLAIFGQRPLAGELMVGSRLLERVQRPPVPTTAIWTRTDGMLIPNSSGHAPGMRAIEVDGVEHLSMLYSGRIFQLVRDLLSAPDPGEVPAPAATEARELPFTAEGETPPALPDPGEQADPTDLPEAPTVVEPEPPTEQISPEDPEVSA